MRLTDLDCDAEGERHGDEDEDEGDEGEDGRADPRALLVGCKKEGRKERIRRAKFRIWLRYDPTFSPRGSTCRKLQLAEIIHTNGYPPTAHIALALELGIVQRKGRRS